MWIPSKAAFRAGSAISDSWDDVNIGQYSFAVGNGTSASGTVSFAAGLGSIASGSSSFAAGSSTASGLGSFAMGEGSIASGDNSIAVGYKTMASGTGSTGFGVNNTCSGNYSTVSGFLNLVKGNYSNAFGSSNQCLGVYSTTFGLQNIGAGDNSTVFGAHNNSSGLYSTTFGEGNFGTGSFSTTFGTYNTSSGYNSSTFGIFNKSSGYNATAMGEGTVAQARSVLSVGRYNIVAGDSNLWVATDPLFVVGNGTSATTTSNALTVLKNGNTGINTPTPATALEVIGKTKTDSLRVVKGAQAGSVLTSDALGNAAWKPLSLGASYFSLVGNNVTLNESYDLTLNHNLFVTQTINWNNSKLVNDQGGSIELGGNNTVGGIGTPYLDFHFNNGKVEDYNTRILNDADGSLRIYAAQGLVIDGKGLLCKEICVQSNLKWCDYVFEKEYKLLSLYEVEKYIKKYKHLPEIPAAETIETNGVNMSEMVNLQMKKIEELTLYTIALQKQLDELRKEMTKFNK